jgi:hypothetical protein
MLDLTHAMQLDATSQVNMLTLLCDRLEEMVHINDQRQVCHLLLCRIASISKIRKDPDTSNLQKASLLRFEGKRSPIGPTRYVQRILKYGRVSECCFLVAIIYIERLKVTGHAVRLSSTSLQRLLAVSVMVAAKFLDEPFYSNKWW